MLYLNEEKYQRSGRMVIGVDEAGRGPLAGPVVAAAVILDHDKKIVGLNDSKKLSSNQRESLFKEIAASSIWKIGICTAREIDEINILQASLLAMKRAVSRINVDNAVCLIDGNFIPENLAHEAVPLIKGDAGYASIAAASIVAKVVRDRLMQKLHRKYPLYNFARNMGYPTAEHLQALRNHGICPCHRLSYKPVKQIEFNFS